MTSPVFVALDTTTIDQATDMARRLTGLVGGIKLGLEFFSAEGPAGVAALTRLGLPLFLDLKLHDIPNTVARAMRALTRLGPEFATLHAAGGRAMMEAAVAATHEEAAHLGLKAPKILAVTVLTSLDQDAMASVGVAGALLDQVRRLADLAQRSGVDGLICSPHEVAELRAQVGPDLLLVVPGIRPTWSETGDQKRFMTPREALDRGADRLVIGRPITAAPDMAAAARRIARDLEERRPS